MVSPKLDSFAEKMVRRAEDLASKETIPHAKQGPDRPRSRAGSGELPPPSGVDPERLPISFRPHVDHPALERALEKAGARLPPGGSAALVHLVEQRLKGRHPDSVSPSERATILDALRAEMARTSPGAEREQRRLREALRRNPSVTIGADMRASTVSVPGGTWIFWHTPSPVSPVIVGESFVPTRTTAPLPKSRPDPRKAGIGGTPLWRTASSGTTTNPPPLPVTPVRGRTGLDPDSLAEGPEIILAEVRRAQAAADEAAKRVTSPVPPRNNRPGPVRTGQRIRSIEVFAPSGGAAGGDWDRLIVVQGVTGPEVPRLPSSELDKVLPPARELATGNEGLARLHAWGVIFGDESLAGLAYGPHKALNLLQKDTVEAFLRWDAKRTSRLNVLAGTPVKVSQYVKFRYVRFKSGGGARLPFVRTVRYDFTIAPGEVVSAVLDISADGKVSSYVLR